jgi:DNA-binding MarR family transcriptional regulator
MTIVPWVAAVAAAIGGGVVGWAAHLAWARRRAEGRAAPQSTVASGPGAPSEGGPPVAPAEAHELPNPPVAPPPVVEASAGPSNEGLGLARRVIVHLASLGRLGPDEVARLGFTQQGMASALSARQGSLVRVLQRLEAAEVLTVDRRHVSGSARRLKVYRLTALGESVARDLRHASRRGSPPQDPVPVLEPPRGPSVGRWVVPPAAPVRPKDPPDGNRAGRPATVFPPR